MNRYSKLIVAGIFLIYLAIGIFIYKDYGFSWDESAARRYCGTLNFKYIAHGDEQLFKTSEKYYGPAFQVLLIGMEKGLHLTEVKEIFLARHLATFLFFFISVVIFYFLCRDTFQSWKLGLLGSLLLIVSPRIFADSFYNSKDIAFLAILIISIFTLRKFIKERTWYGGVLHAFTSALAIDIRIMGIMVPCLTVVLGLTSFLGHDKSADEKQLKFNQLFQYSVLVAGFTILFFPILWSNPVHHFLEAFLNMSRFPFGETVLYLGQDISAQMLPWHYILVWIGITIPIIYSLFFMIGSISIFLRLSRRPLQIFSTFENQEMLLYSCWFFCPLIMIIALRAVLYDGWRHVYYIYPAFVGIALYGVREVLKAARHANYIFIKYSSLVLLILLFGNIVSTGYFMFRNHPFQFAYFNFLAGSGGKTIKSNFDMDYWGVSCRNALEFLARNDKSSEIKYSGAWPAEANLNMLDPSQRSRLKYTSMEDAKYFITNYRWHKEDYTVGKEIYKIEVGDAKILSIYQIKE